MSATVNHTDILKYARSEQWTQMHHVVQQVNMGHTRQAFYVLCKEGRAKAVEQLMHHFDNNYRFICECIVGGLKNNITVDTLKVLDPIVCQHPITAPDILEACLKRRIGSVDDLAHKIISWYDPQFLEQFKVSVHLRLVETITQDENQAFMAILPYWNFSDARFCACIVRTTVECIPHSVENVFDIIGEKNLRNLEEHYSYTNNHLDMGVLHDYFALQQNKRLNSHITNSGPTKPRKL